MHHVDELIALFERTFYADYTTRLVRGEDEPIYLPADEQCGYHRIVFAHGFFASALHEIAHWLVAGAERRTREDYGYWYCPDGRSKEQQQAFEQVEVHPQAIEWALSLAAGFPFNVSADNLGGEQTCRFRFQQRVYDKLVRLIEQGFNARTERLLQALSQHYQQPYPLTPERVQWQGIQEQHDAL
ncbi:elongation factor P hydroxylase [Pseudoalteromonas ruthenica]|uniref:ATPase n=1 Tax=Pseudoalteromonas ruthenica TaxID=151081 RepID=A0A0F4PZC6_9GAMM|nr:elongation factor P hydroxylase [Pseudoalteromonas ruthenica]KJZ00841.1 ATPase [Pseudoalteromonas ruthenica]KJZ01106.1 ATPase [Pseudoalteromonas ruthenica]TMO85735.1 ATPase [Pseudoalteromonas ruthenica]TMO92504.1 ATPase [Pseudoalteromonas ruthenica]TMO98974.1 ATPase [Pseudoalteromonas ruthenica]|tara:strand:- start:90391 stop:90945 length:555 start_codon:yes stop_codon:yes gene_type:complete